MSGTFPPFWGENPSPGVRVSQSTDLTNWSEPRVVLRPDNWYQQLFWAPEIFPYGGRYYLTFNCPAIGSAPIGDWQSIHQSVGLAVAERPLGPYQVLTRDRPLVEGNDGTIFLDADGSAYIYHTARIGGTDGIGCTRLDLVNGATVGDTTLCVTSSDTPGWEGGKNVHVEGPSVFRRGNLYYLIYSSWGRGYEVGYATAFSPRGPWRKATQNPIFGAQDPEWTKKYSGIYTQDPHIPFGQVGHGSPFFGPDKRIWFSCHGIMQKDRGYDLDPHLVLAPMNFAPDGSISMRLTWMAQKVDLARVRPDPFWRSNGSPAATLPASIAGRHRG
jgi:beta-xylosidase